MTALRLLSNIALCVVCFGIITGAVMDLQNHYVGIKRLSFVSVGLLYGMIFAGAAAMILIWI